MSNWFDIGETVGLDGFQHPSNLHLNGEQGKIELIPDQKLVVENIIELNPETERIKFQINFLINSIFKSNNVYYKVSDIFMYTPVNIFDTETQELRYHMLLKTNFITQEHLRKLHKPSTLSYRDMINYLNKTLELV